MGTGGEGCVGRIEGKGHIMGIGTPLHAARYTCEDPALKQQTRINNDEAERVVVTDQHWAIVG